MTQAKQDDKVRIHYTGTLEDGSQFDSSRQGEPFEFTLGADEVIPGFDAAILGMQVGDKKTVAIPPDEAYGPRHEGMVRAFDRGDFPEGEELEVGAQFNATAPEGGSLLLTVTAVEDDKITLDANHPLAGKALTFELELVEIA